jgi:hypothetical protein
VLNGANDTEEFVYCKFALDTKIINIGSMLMCDEVLDTLNTSLTSTGSLKPFTRPYVSDCEGTNIESGIRTINLIPFLPTTTYTDPNDLFPYNMEGIDGYDSNLTDKWGNKLSIFPANSFLDSNEYREKELKDSRGHDLFKYYCRIDFDETTLEGPVSSASYMNTLRPQYLDSEINGYFNCPYNKNGPTRTADKRDHPYFYFGTIDGSTALDKLKKDFFD